MAWDGPQYFSIKVTKSVMKAYIPKGTTLDPTIAELTQSEFVDFLEGQHGIMIPPGEEVLDTLKTALKHNPYGFKQNFDVVVGSEPKEGTPAKLDHVNPPSIPSDMVIQGVPFMRFQAPVPAEDGVDVHGNVIQAPRVNDPLKEIELPDEMEISDTGEIFAKTGGQATLFENKILFKPLYRIDDTTEQVFQNFEFHCDVWIDGDLSGNMKWRVNGNLLVEGHLSAPNIEVNGDLEVKLGIQTNEEGTLRVYGNAKTGYLQMTRMGVQGNLIVDRGILQCDIRAGGDIKCMGLPGAIQGSRIFTLASVQTNRAGSDDGRATEFLLPYVDQTKPIRILSLASGTNMRFKRKSWTSSGKGAFSAQSEESESA